MNFKVENEETNGKKVVLFLGQLKQTFQNKEEEKKKKKKLKKLEADLIRRPCILCYAPFSALSGLIIPEEFWSHTQTQTQTQTQIWELVSVLLIRPHLPLPISPQAYHRRRATPPLQLQATSPGIAISQQPADQLMTDKYYPTLV